MIFALDATPLTVPTGGIRRYTAELARALATEFPDDRYWLVSDQSLPQALPFPNNVEYGAGPRTRAERKWWLWGLDQEMSRLHVDLFHGTDFSVPYLPRRPSVLTLHDLSPWLMSPAGTENPRVRRRTPVLLRLGLTTMVITPSEAVRHEAIARFQLNPDRVVAVPLAANEIFRPVSTVVRHLYFLYVGTLEPRKNIGRLIDAWREVRKHHDVDLVLAGRARAKFPVPANEPGLRVLGETPEEDLAALYSGALACVYPSLYEGFGLPVLEAMQCGAVVVTSCDPAILELSGDAALHVDVEDSRALAEALSAVARGPANFTPLRERALARARQFTWARTARRTREVYDTALRISRKL